MATLYNYLYIDKGQIEASKYFVPLNLFLLGCRGKGAYRIQEFVHLQGITQLRRRPPLDFSVHKA